MKSSILHCASPTWWLLLVSGFVASDVAAAAGDDGRAPLIVSALKGDVRAAAGDHPIAIRSGDTLQPPISLKVGADGAIELQQGLTTISATANSDLDIPKSTDPAETLEKLVQSHGNVYYSVAKRPSHKLNVETPFLVAVIKGTKFNVSASDASSTVSLLEGNIEIHGGVGDVLDLKAGQMAVRSNERPAVQVIQMTTGAFLRNPTAPHDANVSSQPNPWHDGATRATAVASQSGAGTSGSVATDSASVGSSAFGGSMTASGDDHGGSATLALNQLVTETAANSGSTAVGTTTTGGPSSAATGGGNAGGNAGNTAGKNSTAGAGSTAGSGTTAGVGSSGTTTTGSSGTGASAGTAATGTTGTGSSNTGTSGMSANGNSGSSSQGSNNSGNGNSGNGNGNDNGNGNGDDKGKGNSGSNSGTKSPGKASGKNTDLTSTLDSLLTTKKK